MHLLKKIAVIFLWNALLLSTAQAINAKATPQIIGWVPPYGIDASTTALNTNPKIGQSLTRIGLQFWNPGADGRSVVFAPIDQTGKQVDAQSVIQLRDWAKARKIQVLLTVYNNSQVIGKWDWPLAKRAFKDNRTAFITALVAEMERYKLDGIDLDLEGEGNFDEDHVAYAAFVKALSKVVHAKGKILTIDSFHSPCANAPNMRWWADWKGQIEEIHSMGYQDLYEASTDTFTPNGQAICEGGAHIFKYSWQLQYAMKAGFRKNQILMGMPTWLDKWGKKDEETDPVSHVREIQALGVGFALWDLQLPSPAWRSDATWDAIRVTRDKPLAK